MPKPFWYPFAFQVYNRDGYYGSTLVRSHADLTSIKVEYFGPGVRDVHDVFIAAYRATLPRPFKRGPRCLNACVEVILSTDRREGCLPGPDVMPMISESEALRISRKLIDGVWGVFGIVGVHTHSDGRVDIHILLVNTAFNGNGLESGLVNPDTNRPYRSLKVVGRAILKRIVDDLNLERRKEGRELLITMYQAVARKIERRAKARIAAREIIKEFDKGQETDVTIENKGERGSAAFSNLDKIGAVDPASDTGEDMEARESMPVPIASDTPLQPKGTHAGNHPKNDHGPIGDRQGLEQFSNVEKSPKGTSDLTQVAPENSSPSMPSGPELEPPHAPSTKKKVEVTEEPKKRSVEPLILEELELILSYKTGYGTIKTKELERLMKKWLKEDGRLREEKLARLYEEAKEGITDARKLSEQVDSYYLFLLQDTQEKTPAITGPEL